MGQDSREKPRKLKSGLHEPGPFGSSTIHYLLTNPVYIGQIRHKGTVYDGQHEAILSLELWQKVQNHLIAKSMTVRSHRKHRQKNLLRGILFDQAGRPYIPTYTNKPGKQYRYYKLKEKPVAEGVLDRIPAHEIEIRVQETVRQELGRFDNAASLLNINLTLQPDLIQMINHKQDCIPGRDIVLKGVEKVVVDQAQITVFVNIEKLSLLISDNLHIAIPQTAADTKEIIVPYITRRAHRGAIVIQPDKPDSRKDPLDLPSGKLRNLVRGLIWRDEHFGGMTLRDIAKREKFSEGYVGQCIFRTFEIFFA